MIIDVLDAKGPDTPGEAACPLCRGGEDCYPYAKVLEPGEHACDACEATMRGQIVVLQNKIEFLQQQLDRA